MNPSATVVARLDETCLAASISEMADQHPTAAEYLSWEAQLLERAKTAPSDAEVQHLKERAAHFRLLAEARVQGSHIEGHFRSAQQRTKKRRDDGK